MKSDNIRMSWHRVLGVGFLETQALMYRHAFGQSI